MKFRLLSVLAAALLGMACAMPSVASAAVPVTAAATAAVQQSPDYGSAEALSDPEDGSKASEEPFFVKNGETGISADGSVYTITEAGEYTISGLLSDGQIVVDAGDDDDVKLILSGASISSGAGAPIFVKNAAEVTVKAEEGTYNTVTDLRTGSADETEDDAAIYAVCDLKLSGSGTLIVSTSFDNGIKSKDDLSVKNLTLKVTAAGNALKGNDSVTVKSGSLILISIGSDGIKTENSDISSKGKQRGTVTISGGQTDIYAARDGISAAYNAEISEEESCVLNIYTASYAGTEAAAGTETYLIIPSSIYSEDLDYYAYLYNNDDMAGIYVKCAYDTMVYSGRTAYYGLAFRIPEGYDNILFEITGAGEIPDGVSYKAATTGETVNTVMNGYLITSVSGGRISGDWVQITDGGDSSKTTYSSKGIKAENAITVSGGTVSVQAMDDGLHANGGTELENGTQGLGSVTVSGGSVTVVSADDGLHADGALTVSGGMVTVEESHEGLEANVITLSGGSVFVYADDDGLNACKGSEAPMVYITGGHVEIRTPAGDTDAIDSNGSFAMSGGTVLVLSGSAMGGMSGSVDVDGTVSVTGGTIVALGAICSVPGNGSVNTYVSNGTGFSAGKYDLMDGNGNTIFSFTLGGSYTSCWIASEAFQTGGSYVLERDGSAVLSWTQSSSMEGDSAGFGGFGNGWGGNGGHGGYGNGGHGGRR